MNLLINFPINKFCKIVWKSIRAIFKVLPLVENLKRDRGAWWDKNITSENDVGIMQQVSGHQGTAIKLALFDHQSKIQVCRHGNTEK